MEIIALMLNELCVDYQEFRPQHFARFWIIITTGPAGKIRTCCFETVLCVRGCSVSGVRTVKTMQPTVFMDNFEL